LACKKLSGGVLAWLFICSEVQIAYGSADPIATHCLLFQEIQIGFGFTFLVPVHPGSPSQNPEDGKIVAAVVVEIYREHFVDASTRQQLPHQHWHQCMMMHLNQ